MNTFLLEIKLFYEIARTDLENNIKTEEVIEELTRLVESYYGARLKYDLNAIEKVNFIVQNMEKILQQKNISHEVESFIQYLSKKSK